MTDFLTALAAQSLGMTTGVMPRRASRFEVEPLRSPGLVDLERDQDESPVVAQAAPRPPAAPPITDDGAVVASQAAQPAAAADAGRDPADAEASRRQPEGDDRAAHDAPRAESAPVAPVPIARVGELLVQRPDAAQTAAETRPGSPQAGVPGVARDEALAGDERSPQPVRHQARGRVTAPPEPPFAPAAPFAAPERDDATGSDGGDEPRGVQVTVSIGRIEIRPPSPAPAPVARPPVEPQLSLGEYLARANGRRR